MTAPLEAVDAYAVYRYPRRELDFYETPTWCTEALLNQYGFRKKVWEPAAGLGKIARVLKDRHYDVRATDIKKWGWSVYDFQDVEEFDFLQCEYPVDEDIITNPPYKLAEEFVMKACDVTRHHKGRVAMLFRADWDSAASRKHLFTLKPFAKKLVLTRRPRWIEDTTGSPRHNYAWYIWDWNHEGEPTIGWGH